MSNENTTAAAKAPTFELPLLTKDFKKWGSEKIDHVIKGKGVGEIIDGPLALASLMVVDAIFAPKIKDSFKEKFHQVQTEIMEADYKGAIDVSLDYLNEKLDIPGIPEETETMFVNTIKGILFAIL